ncbi:putative 2-hydroxy-palmitic acid dioxygenase Mpo1 [Helianthus debilis subsp. tardiflorus]
MNFKSMEEFWPFYMKQHSKPATRRWHFAGTLSSILCLIYAVLFNWWFVFLVPLVGYGMAWYSHFYVEGRKHSCDFWSSSLVPFVRLQDVWVNAHRSDG